MLQNSNCAAPASATDSSASTHARAERISFVVGRDGRIVATVGGLAPAANVAAVLAEVERLAGR